MRMTKTGRGIYLAISVVGALALGCSGTSLGTGGAGGSGGGGTTELVDPGKTVSVSATPTASAEEERLRGELDELKGLTAGDFATRFAPVAEAAPKYERSAIVGLDKIQASSLALDEAALAKLDENGFAISNAHPFPTFAYGYQTLYMEDLPLYVSADSILTAVHQSYDSMLATLEEQVLSNELEKLL